MHSDVRGKFVHVSYVVNPFRTGVTIGGIDSRWPEREKSMLRLSTHIPLSQIEIYQLRIDTFVSFTSPARSRMLCFHHDRAVLNPLIGYRGKAGVDYPPS